MSKQPRPWILKILREQGLALEKFAFGALGRHGVTLDSGVSLDTRNFVGCGLYGCVMDVLDGASGRPTGYVLKLTSDPGELLGWSWLQKLDLPGVVKILAVGKGKIPFKGPTEIMSVPIVVVREKVDSFEDRPRERTDDWTFDRALRAYEGARMRQKFWGPEPLLRLVSALQDYPSSRALGDAIQTLFKRGLLLTDLHANNVGWRKDGTLVLLDPSVEPLDREKPRNPKRVPTVLKNPRANTGDERLRALERGALAAPGDDAAQSAYVTAALRSFAPINTFVLANMVRTMRGAQRAVVIKPTGRMTKVMNLGWLLKEAGKRIVAAVEIVGGPTTHAPAELVVRFADGHVYATSFGSQSSLWWFLDRPVLHGAPGVFYDMTSGTNTRGTITRGVAAGPQRLDPGWRPPESADTTTLGGAPLVNPPPVLPKRRPLTNPRSPWLPKDTWSRKLRATANAVIKKHYDHDSATAGGCWIVAEALKQLHGGKLEVLYQATDDMDDPWCDPLAHHVVVRLPDGRLLDGDGLHTDDHMIAKAMHEWALSWPLRLGRFDAKALRACSTEPPHAASDSRFKKLKAALKEVGKPPKSEKNPPVGRANLLVRPQLRHVMLGDVDRGGYSELLHDLLLYRAGYSYEQIDQIMRTPLPVRSCPVPGGISAQAKHEFWRGAPKSGGAWWDDRDDEFMEDMKASIMAGKRLPPIVLHHGALLDGFHRTLAHAALGLHEIDCVKLEEWAQAAGVGEGEPDDQSLSRWRPNPQQNPPPAANEEDTWDITHADLADGGMQLTKRSSGQRLVLRGRKARAAERAISHVDRLWRDFGRQGGHETVHRHIDSVLEPYFSGPGRGRAAGWRPL